MLYISQDKKNAFFVQQYNIRMQILIWKKYDFLIY